MSFVDDLRRMADDVRGNVPGALGLRPHTVTVRVRTWTGARAGLGTKTDVDTVITNAGGYGPRVVQVSAKDVVASGGLYEAGDYRIGPISRDYTGGGTTDAALNPATTSTAREVFFCITGPGFPSSGQWFKRVNDEGYKRHTQTMVVVRETAETP